jgi:zona occludens toxin
MTIDKQDKKGEGEQPEGHGLWNWWTWAKPGDVLVCDEVQRHWRPRGMGTKPPEEIAKLEVHRHYGVDFVLITQNAMLLDQNVRRLVGRHLHVRRLFGTARALIYDWDGCQTDTTRTSGATRTVWSYPKDAYKLYKSSELHTKQHQKIPLFLAFPLVVAALGAFAGPKAYDAMHRSMTGKSLEAKAPAAPGTQAKAGKQQAAALPTAAASSPQPQPTPVQVAAAPMALAAGCMRFRDRCDCYSPEGLRMTVQPEVCTDGIEHVGTLVPLLAVSSASSRPAPSEAPSPARPAGEPASSPRAPTPAPSAAVQASSGRPA